MQANLQALSYRMTSPALLSWHDTCAFWSHNEWRSSTVRTAYIWRVSGKECEYNLGDCFLWVISAPALHHLQTRRRTSRKEMMLLVAQGNCSRKVITSCAKVHHFHAWKATCAHKRESPSEVLYCRCVLGDLRINPRKVCRELIFIYFCVKD